LSCCTDDDEVIAELDSGGSSEDELSMTSPSEELEYMRQHVIDDMPLTSTDEDCGGNSLDDDNSSTEELSPPEIGCSGAVDEDSSPQAMSATESAVAESTVVIPVRIRAGFIIFLLLLIFSC
jgi:hypothetical protein